MCSASSLAVLHAPHQVCSTSIIDIARVNAQFGFVHVWTASAVQGNNLTFRETFGCSHVFGL
jgi:hypothetical protein